MPQPFPFNVGTIHIVGIGGIGMSGYAEILHNMGYKVQGSDQSDNANVQRLQAMGITVHIGHDAGNVLDEQGNPVTVVVKSTAVKDANPEIIAARGHNIPVIPRVDLLAELMRAKWAVNISGTHGKTTTTSMIGHVLEKSGLDPTVINGGIINAYGSNARLGGSKWMVVESDESDGTFAQLPSVASVITNIDPEHLDFYGDFDALKDAFVAYAHNLPFYGVLVACIDHPVVEELMPRFNRRTITYGFSDKADLQAVNVRATPQGLCFDIKVNKRLEKFPEEIRNVQLPMFGRHNVLNALAAFGTGHDIGIPAEKIVSALSQFAGVKRRFTITGTANDVTVIDDYGHHPVEIAAVLKAGREALEGAATATGTKGKIVAVIQPHRYTRLANLFDDFARCAAEADEVIIAPVYTAGEAPIDGIDHKALVAAMKKAGHANVTALEKPEDLAALIHARANPGDLVICLGAGSITHWANALPAELAALNDAAPPAQKRKTANGKGACPPSSDL
jgi:UDP-N-acetylmuramate--alanine ligase